LQPNSLGKEQGIFRDITGNAFEVAGIFDDSRPCFAQACVKRPIILVHKYPTSNPTLLSPDVRSGQSEFDIAKSIFQVHGVDAGGQVVIRLQLKRRYVLAFFEKLQPCLIGVEACASSHIGQARLILF
jgi:hypothetical protein